MADILNHDSYSSNPKIGVRFYLYEPEPGVKKVLEEYEPKTLRFVSKDRVVSELIKYTAFKLGGSGQFAFTERQAIEAVNYWIALTDAMKTLPKIVAEKDYPGLAIHRLPFNFEKDSSKPCPVFDEFLSRCSNSEALMAWIGSLFYDNASRQQYVWIYGEGGDGKGSIVRMLNSIFASAFASQTVPDPSSRRFWTYSLLGKRLVVFPDCNNYSFPNDGLFKSLTGGDAVSFERKMENPFTATPTCMFMFLSNDRPNISGQKSNMRRAIYCEVSPITGEQKPQYVIDNALWEEAPSIIGKCLAKYEELCPDYGSIPTKEELLDELVRDNEEANECLFQKYFAATGDHKDYVRASKLQEIKNLEHISHNEWRNFIAYIKRRYKVKQATIERGNIRVYRGMRNLTASESINYVADKER